MKRIFPILLVFSLAFGPAHAAAAKRVKYKAVEIKNGGTITGTVKWEGALPQLKPFPITRDPEFCDLDKTGVKKSPRLVLDPQMGVANSVVYLEDIEKGKKLQRFSKAKPLTWDQKGCEYSPHVLVVPVKSYLGMRSSDAILHNIHMFGAASYNLPFPEKRTVITKRMRKKGVITLRCDAGHGWMSGIIFVVGHPYYAVTDARGNFTLRDVPPGKYTLRAWHEGWNVVKTIKKDGKPAFYEFDEPRVLSRDVTVPAGGGVSVRFTLRGK
ncbi:MAG: carboxypeptidase regulatory-like domain-containing protein [Nitrospinota bacterium]